MDRRLINLVRCRRWRSAGLPDRVLMASGMMVHFQTFESFKLTYIPKVNNRRRALQMEKFLRRPLNRILMARGMMVHSSV